MTTEPTNNTYYPPSDQWTKQNNAESVSSSIVSELISYQDRADAAPKHSLIVRLLLRFRIHSRDRQTFLLRAMH